MNSAETKPPGLSDEASLLSLDEVDFILRHSHTHPDCQGTADLMLVTTALTIEIADLSAEDLMRLAGHCTHFARLLGLRIVETQLAPEGGEA